MIGTLCFTADSPTDADYCPWLLTGLGRGVPLDSGTVDDLMKYKTLFQHDLRWAYPPSKPLDSGSLDEFSHRDLQRIDPLSKRPGGQPQHPPYVPGRERVS